MLSNTLPYMLGAELPSSLIETFKVILQSTAARVKIKKTNVTLKINAGEV